jgi:hypothetical protein
MRKHIRYRRSKNSIYTKITASLPFIEVNVNLTAPQIAMFIQGLRYITPCHSRYSRQSIKYTLDKQYDDISATIKECMRDHHMSVSDQQARKAFSELEQLVHQLPSNKPSRQLDLRSRREHRIVRSIQRLLNQRLDIAVCRVDKTKAFYVGSAAGMLVKAYDYMASTQAYEKMTDDGAPLADSWHAVQKLLDYLVKTRGLTRQQANRLNPNLNRLELAHYHGLPKTHKVNLFFLALPLYATLPWLL